MTIEEEARALEGKGLQFMETAAAGISLRTKIEAGVVLLALLAAGIWWLMRDPPPIPEVVTAAPQVRQTDGSMEASRESTPQPAPAPHLIPKGYKETSRATATVAPTPAAAASGCPPVRLVLSTVVDGNSRRIIASSLDGEVIAAKDEIIEPILMPAPPKAWAAGLGYTTQREVGVWVGRDIGRLRIEAEVLKGAGAPRAEIRVGVAF